MRVILDANIIIADPWLAGADFRVLLTSLSATGYKLLIPALALDEAVNKYGEKLSEAHRQMNEAADDLRKLLREPSAGPVDLDREARVAKYRAYLREHLAKVGAIVVPYPRVSHKRLVRRALERRRPFNEKGAGYRDALIWHCVLGQAREGSVAFVSNDKGDFFHNGKEPHPDLVHDARGLPALSFFRTLRDFVEKEVKPKLSDAGAIRDALNRTGRYKALDVKHIVSEHLFGELRYLDAEILGIIGEPGFSTLLGIEEVANVNVTDVHRVTDREYVIDVVTDCEVRFEMYVWEDFDEERISLPNPSDDELLDDAYPRALLRVSASFTVNPDDGSVTAVEVRDVGPAI